MASDAVQLIKDDHRVLEGLFDRLEAGEGDRRALIQEVAARLTAHSRAEEREVYPAVKEADPGEGDDVDHSYHEHQEAEHLLRKVRNLIDSPHFDQALTEFVAAVKHHVEQEETQVLPALKKSVDAATLQQLGEAFSQARAEQLRETGLAEPGTGGAQEGDDLAEATRDELYDMAKQADIPGRSAMNKNELAQALREQS